MAEFNNEYINYQNMVATVNMALSDLEKLCAELKLEERRQEIERIQHKLANHTFSVGIMGEFKRGKSTVINSLLEKEIMPADILPCSATMNRVTYDLRPHVQLNMRDGSNKDIPVEELASYVTKLTAENESRAAEVDEAIVYYPCRFCQNGVDIVDTPGLNDDERMNKISEEVVPKLDAVIMVLTPDNPFSMSEAEFVRNKLMASDLSRLIFVVNKIDTIRRAADRARVVESIREKIQSSVMEKMANLYGQDSPEYHEAIKKIGKIRVYPLSALDALDGKLDGDQELIKKSGTLEFESALTKMLTEDRGALELSTTLNAITKACTEVAQAVAVRKNALDLNAAEFTEYQNNVLAEITQLRQAKKDERIRLQDNAKKTRLELNQQITAFYPTLQSKLNASLDSAAEEINLKQLESAAGNKATAQFLQTTISKVCQDELSLFAEQIQTRLDQIIGKDLASAGNFVSSVSDKLTGVNRKMFEKQNFDTTDLLASGAEFISIFANMYGIGGAIAGYKAAGWGGALTGGGVGAFATLAAGSLLASMSVAGLPLLLLASVAGTMSGKYATKFLFRKNIGKQKLEEIKKSLREGIDEIVFDLQNRRDLENWCDKLVDSRYDELITAVEEETERLLKSTEASIDEIKHDMAENEATRKQLTAHYDEILRTIRTLIDQELNPIAVRVRTALENS